jgi:hypothetical protein
MTASKYIRNSAIHRTLEAICMSPYTDVELKPKITRESLGRFIESCITPLLADRFIIRRNGFYESTEAGRNRLEYLGPSKKQIPHRKPSTWMERSMYDGVELKAKAVRPGADDHEQCPSLVGNTRFWRDGREEVGHE